MKNINEIEWRDRILRKKIQHAGTDLEQPECISLEARKAWYVIVMHLEEWECTYTGGCKLFFNYSEMKDINEDVVGDEGLLYFICDGGAPRSSLFFEGEDYKNLESLCEKLSNIGMYVEQYNHVYATLYLCEKAVDESIDDKVDMLVDTIVQGCDKLIDIEDDIMSAAIKLGDMFNTSFEDVAMIDIKQYAREYRDSIIKDTNSSPKNILLNIVDRKEK